ncbi:MAG: DUF2017 family protein [Egibacteraceae bacterium]
MRRSGVRRRSEGGVAVRLSGAERELLRSLPDQLRPILAGEQDAAGAVGRLYPPGYDEPDAEAAYRDLVGESLVAERLDALEAFAQTLDGGQLRGPWWTTDLDGEQADAWLSAVNDARLVLGTVLGITDETAWDLGPDDQDPTSVAIYYLGWLQEALVGALMGGLPDVPGS